MKCQKHSPVYLTYRSGAVDEGELTSSRWSLIWPVSLPFTKSSRIQLPSHSLSPSDVHSFLCATVAHVFIVILVDQFHSLLAGHDEVFHFFRRIFHHSHFSISDRASSIQFDRWPVMRGR